MDGITLWSALAAAVATFMLCRGVHARAAVSVVKHRRRIALVRRLWLSLPLVPALALADPIAGLKPMAFVAGHCWKGTFPDGQTTDEHCFEWLYGGKFLRDRHVVRNPSRPDYVGEAFYYWDAEAKRIEYVYLENLGGVSRGRAEAASDGMVFPAARYVDETTALTYRARWTWIGDSAYEAHSEAQGKDGWATMFKVKLERQ